LFLIKLKYYKGLEEPFTTNEYKEALKLLEEDNII